MLIPYRACIYTLSLLLVAVAFCWGQQLEGQASDDRGFRSSTKAPANANPVSKARKDYALFFATNSYESWKPLTNPIPDARALQREVEQAYGFETTLVQNPTLAEIINSLAELRKRQFGEQDQVLIFFAGHGVFDESTREGFLVTRDADVNDTTRSHYLSYSRLRDLIDSLPAKHVLLVIDACFGGTIDRRIADSGSRGQEQYALLSLPELVSRKSALTTRKFVTSGGKEYVPDGLPGHNSPFTAHLLEALRTYGGKRGYLTINGILTEVEAVHPQPVWGDWGRDEPGSEFLFIPKELRPIYRTPTIHCSRGTPAIRRRLMSRMWSQDARWRYLDSKMRRFDKIGTG